MRRLREVLYTTYGEPRLVLPGLVVLVLTFVVGYAAMRGVQTALPLEQRAAALASTRKFAQAEEIYARLVRERGDGQWLIALLSNHQVAVAMQKLKKLRSGEDGLSLTGGTKIDDAVMTDEVLDAFIDRLPPDLARLGRFLRALEKGSPPSELKEELVLGAKADPPVPWFNHALGSEAMRRAEVAEAAAYFEREGMSFPARHEDLDRALLLYIQLGDWAKVTERLADPRVARVVDAHVKYTVAVHERDWSGAARWLVVAWRPHLTLTTGIMAGVAAIAWAFFCARLGRIGERPKRRLAFYVIAFALGVLSVVPTALIIAVEEAKLKLVVTGDALRDALFFVFGVGLREEASKLLLFVPLLPFLRKWGEKLDVLVCGSLVGLGFAAEENLNYLAGGDLHTGLARFLTANFMHMAMTGILASALDDFVTDRERNAADFSRTTIMVVGMHGAYDFLLSHEEMGGSYIAMAVFFFLVRMFLEKVETVRRKADGGFSLSHAFIVALGVVTGTTAVYAVAAVGPAQGAIVLAEGLLGIAVLVYAFVRTLRGM
ncbi:MAG: PrsW family intramembrane metalloprotease [Deltaproteobacteria bacterium]|nr:PrsW family intramembrane metalloprotease [Deltaproteobacteria bacterium]